MFLELNYFRLHVLALSLLSLISFCCSFHIISSILLFCVAFVSSKQEFTKHLVWFFYSGSVEDPAFYLPIFRAWAVQYVWSVKVFFSPSTHTSHASLLFAMSFLPNLEYLFSLSTTTLTLKTSTVKVLMISFLFKVFYRYTPKFFLSINLSTTFVIAFSFYFFHCFVFLFVSSFVLSSDICQCFATNLFFLLSSLFSSVLHSFLFLSFSDITVCMLLVPCYSYLHVAYFYFLIAPCAAYLDAFRICAVFSAFI